MKKIVFGILFTLIIGVTAFADEGKFTTLEKADDNYFLIGYANHPVKLQLAVKTEIINTSGLYFGYVETALWDVNVHSEPFYDYNHSPYAEYSFRSKDNLFSVDSGYLKFISVGVRHKSNGQSGIYNRSMNYVYSDGQVKYDTELGTFNLYGKYFHYFKVSHDNPDYKQYNGQTEWKVSFNNDYVEVYSRAGVYCGSQRKYIDYPVSLYKVALPWIESGVSVRLAKDIEPKIFAQYRYGYNEGMIDYNKREQSVRIGVML